MRALRRRARVASRQGRDAFAVACLRRVVEVGAADAACFHELGQLHQRRGDYVAALEAHLQALRLAPRDVELHLALARVLVAQELFGDAVGICERAVRLDAEHAGAFVLLADGILGARGIDVSGDAAGDGDVAHAMAYYERALQLDAHATEAYCGIARVHLDRGERREALAVLERGLGVVAHVLAAPLHLEMAAVLLHPEASGAEDADVPRAIDALRTALNLRPRDVRACRLLIDALDRGASASTSASASAASAASVASVASTTDVVGAWFVLGVALQEAGDLLGAAEAFERAIACKADCLRAWLRLGSVRLALGQPEDAVRCFDAAVAMDPEHPVAHVNLGWALRTAGDFTRGWKESAWHYRAGDMRRFEQPVWDGAALGARTILVWADFALGDTIQDLRFLPLIRAAHPRARIVFECDRRLVPLLEKNTAEPRLADVIIASKAPLPSFDVHLPLRRLPELLGIELASLPLPSEANGAYLALDAPPRSNSIAMEQKSGSAEKRIGIVWAGDQTRPDTRIKSASLADFEPLLELLQQEREHERKQHPRVRIISLQFGSTADELIALPPGLAIDRVIRARDYETGDIAYTAMVMNTLDVIITVDTMAAHLAGALGRPVWVVAAHAPAWWLWHVDRDGRSLWYPTMRIFRQPRASDWHSVIQDIRVALRADLTLP